MKRLFEYFLLLTALLFSGGANAGVTITFAQSGSNVVATATGTFTLPQNPQSLPSSGTSGMMYPSRGQFVFAFAPNFATVPSTNIDCGSYSTNSGTVAFGSLNSYELSSSATGDVFGFDLFNGTKFVVLPVNFTSGAPIPINSTVTFSNLTLASLGLYSSDTVYTCGSDTITIVAPSIPPPSPSPSPAPIPTLSEWAQFIMMLLMIGTVGWYTRRMFR